MQVSLVERIKVKYLGRFDQSDYSQGVASYPSEHLDRRLSVF